MQLAKMVVLGTLDILGIGSGYDIYQYLSRTQIDKWTDLQKASIYHGLRQLEKESLIDTVEQIRVGRYPEKSLYMINEEGRRVFDILQAEAFRGIYPRFFGFKLALKFNRRRSAEEIKIFALEAVAVIDRQMQMMKEHLSKLPEESQEKKRDEFFVRHDQQLYLAERQWILEAVDYIKENGIWLAENGNVLLE